MAITVSGGKKPPSRSTPPRKTGDDMNPAKFEVYGRLDLTVVQIAQLENVTPMQMNALMRNPHLRTAYYKGRAETTVALRQKQIAVALAGDTRMLIYAGEKFAGQSEGTLSGIPEDFNPGQHSWDGKSRSRLEDLRAKFSDDDTDEDAETG